MSETAQTDHTPDPTDRVELARSELVRIASRRSLAVTMLAITNHRTPTAQVLSMPISRDLADTLLARCTEFSETIVELEFKQWDPGFTASDHQCLVHDDAETGVIDAIDTMVRLETHDPYSPNRKLGRLTNLLALRVNDSASGELLGTFYQSLGSAQSLEKRRAQTIFWSGEAFTHIEEQTLVLKPLQLVVTASKTVVARTSTAYGAVFGPLPELAVEAAETFDRALKPLGIEGGANFEKACKSNPLMMSKLISIQQKMKDPAYADKLDKAKLLAFVKANSHVLIETTGDGVDETIVFDTSPQKRWAILKLLDDDYLRSDLTDANYEANSKHAL